MCLIAFAWNIHPRIRFALIGNRDEFHARPSSIAAPHPEAPEVFGGRDLEKGGSWLLVSQHGRLAAVTNVRAGLPPETAPRSRGELVDRFARSALDAPAFLDGLRRDAPDYGRFNLLLWDGRNTLLATNHPTFASRELGPGAYGLSNGDFDADWPKVRRARGTLEEWLADPGEGQDIEPLFAALRDEAPASDPELPDTGVGLELERLLAPPFIRGDRYGTRASSVVLIDDDTIDFTERRYVAEAAPAGETRMHLDRIRTNPPDQTAQRGMPTTT